ncbi:hypothetical protein NDU88_006445 [Pleurodeles waltl]|uniref:Uncharacterized protein n=1 Tax=Pleurodeles waltl TaxID=8319 RepID=A0AAV7SPS7_PLEWA|nr:hypothetical protein NDU88_006445 [Pleurodeles waltl]
MEHPRGAGMSPYHTEEEESAAAIVAAAARIARPLWVALRAMLCREPLWMLLEPSAVIAAAWNTTLRAAEGNAEEEESAAAIVAAAARIARPLWVALRAMLCREPLWMLLEPSAVIAAAWNTTLRAAEGNAVSGRQADHVLSAVLALNQPWLGSRFLVEPASHALAHALAHAFRL